MLAAHTCCFSQYDTVSQTHTHTHTDTHKQTHTAAHAVHSQWTTGQRYMHIHREYAGMHPRIHLLYNGGGWCIFELFCHLNNCTDWPNGSAIIIGQCFHASHDAFDTDGPVFDEPCSTDTFGSVLQCWVTLFYLINNSFDNELVIKHKGQRFVPSSFSNVKICYFSLFKGVFCSNPMHLGCVCLAVEFKYQQAFSRIVDYTFNFKFTLIHLGWLKRTRNLKMSSYL